MDDFEAEYKSKLSTLDDALDSIKSGDVIYTSVNAQEPVGFLERLASLSDRVDDVTIYSTGFEYPYRFLTDSAVKGHIQTHTSFVDRTMRRHHDLGIVDYVPVHLHEWFDRDDLSQDIDVFVGAVTPMDRHGYFRFGLGNGTERDALEKAKRVILEVNSNFPTIYGFNEIHISQVDQIYENTRALYERPQIEPDDVSKAVGRNVASLIEDGATLQVGVGKITDAAVSCLTDRNDLGVHTEMISTSLAQLAERGVINGRRKTLLPGKFVGGFAIGTKELYDFLDGNPTVLLAPSKFINDPAVIAKNRRMTSVNSAIQIDLTGQVCSESVGPLQLSGTGGASDFAVGASHAPEGKSIIALRSTAKDDTISTIRPLLNTGAVVSVNRNDVDYVVTEYGIARLKGRTLKERAAALTEIAHPDFRDELREAARHYQIW